MTTSTPASVTASQTAESGGKGLKSGALGLLASIVIGIASTAPAYSLAASIGLVSEEVGVKAPLIMILAFVPILFISYAYRALNSRIPDCGTNFTWGARAFGPHVGWMSGWGAIIAQVIVLANLAQIAGIYSFKLVGADGLADSVGWVALAGSIWLVLMTYIAYRGIEVSARLQVVLLALELIVLLIFSIVSLVEVYNGSAGNQAIKPAFDWFNPFSGLTGAGLSAGVLVAIFAYWGWDTCVSTNEETENSSVTPGRSAVISTLLLFVTYVLVTVATQSVAGIGTAASASATPTTRARPSRRSPGSCSALLGQGTDPRRALVVGRVGPDDDPAGRPFDARDGGRQGAAERFAHVHPPRTGTKRQGPVLQGHPAAPRRSCLASGHSCSASSSWSSTTLFGRPTSAVRPCRGRIHHDPTVRNP